MAIGSPHDDRSVLSGLSSPRFVFIAARRGGGLEESRGSHGDSGGVRSNRFVEVPGVGWLGHDTAEDCSSGQPGGDTWSSVQPTTSAASGWPARSVTRCPPTPDRSRIERRCQDGLRRFDPSDRIARGGQATRLSAPLLFHAQQHSCDGPSELATLPLPAGSRHLGSTDTARSGAVTTGRPICVRPRMRGSTRAWRPTCSSPTARQAASSGLERREQPVRRPCFPTTTGTLRPSPRNQSAAPLSCDERSLGRDQTGPATRRATRGRTH